MRSAARCVRTFAFSNRDFLRGDLADRGGVDAISELRAQLLDDVHKDVRIFDHPRSYSYLLAPRGPASGPSSVAFRGLDLLGELVGVRVDLSGR